MQQTLEMNVDNETYSEAVSEDAMSSSNIDQLVIDASTLDFDRNQQYEFEQVDEGFSICRRKRNLWICFLIKVMDSQPLVTGKILSELLKNDYSIDDEVYQKKIEVVLVAAVFFSERIISFRLH